MRASWYPPNIQCAHCTQPKLQGAAYCIAIRYVVLGLAILMSIATHTYKQQYSPNWYELKNKLTLMYPHVMLLPTQSLQSKHYIVLDPSCTTSPTWLQSCVFAINSRAVPQAFLSTPQR